VIAVGFRLNLALQFFLVEKWFLFKIHFLNSIEFHKIPIEYLLTLLLRGEVSDLELIKEDIRY